MGFGRHILAGTAFAGLAACAPTTQYAGGPAALSIASVSVDTSAMVVEGRPLPVSTAQAASDLRAAILSVLAEDSAADGVPVDVTVSMSMIRLAPPVERIVAGTSSATGAVQLTRAGTEEALGAPVSVTGNTTNIRAVGVIGLATTVTPENDYRGTIAGFAEATRTTLFGSDT